MNDKFNSGENNTSTDISLGFGMALAQNIDAMRYFSRLTKSERQKILNKANDAKSKEEMQQFVASLGNDNNTTL